MTERASRLSQSRCAAISRLFVRAMLSLCQCFSGSILALSVCFAATSPKGRGTGEEGNFAVCQSLPSIGKVARRRRDGEVWFTMASRTKSKKRQIPKIPSKSIETFFERRVMDFPPSTAQIGYNSRRRGTGIGRARRGGETREKEAADLPSAPSRTSLCPAGGTFWRKRSAEHRYDPTRIY